MQTVRIGFTGPSRITFSAYLRILWLDRYPKDDSTSTDKN